MNAVSKLDPMRDVIESDRAHVWHHISQHKQL